MSSSSFRIRAKPLATSNQFEPPTPNTIGDDNAGKMYRAFLQPVISEWSIGVLHCCFLTLVPQLLLHRPALFTSVARPRLFDISLIWDNIYICHSLFIYGVCLERVVISPVSRIFTHEGFQSQGIEKCFNFTKIRVTAWDILVQRFVITLNEIINCK